MEPAASFDVKLSFKGKSKTLPNITSHTTIDELEQLIRSEFNIPDDNSHGALKLLCKGKDLSASTEKHVPAFPNGISSKTVKILVMCSPVRNVEELNSGRSDPTIRGFDNEKQRPIALKTPTWGTGQNKEYKFCKFQACTWQSFGHRTGSKTPHAFRAMTLLEKLATDPGIVAVMVERELIVGTLGEMDPIDDRLKKNMESQGRGCLLGYNTNNGTRIDLKLRTDDLSGFLPYSEIAATLLHELSHNWVSEHNALFWTNFGQMRVEYLHKHASLAAAGFVIDGRTSAELACVSCQCENGMTSIYSAAIEEVAGEATRHGVPVQMIAPAIKSRCDELVVDGKGSERGQILGGGINETNGNATSAREFAFAAAERRAKEKREDDRTD